MKTKGQQIAEGIVNLPTNTNHAIMFGDAPDVYARYWLPILPEWSLTDAVEAIRREVAEAIDRAADAL